jgi:hypothetical protein
MFGHQGSSTAVSAIVDLRRLIAAAFLLQTGFINPAIAQSQLDAENLIVTQPPGWKVGSQMSHDNRSTAEWVPASETVDDWTQMITIGVYRHATVDAATFLQRITQRWLAACPGSQAKGIVTGQTNAYVVSMQVLTCPKNTVTGKPEVTAFRAIKGQDALYSVQRAFRSIPNDAEFNDTIHFLSTVTVCDTRTPDHLCPGLGRPISQP